VTVTNAGLTAAALLVDRIVGDPTVPPHPVVIMGRYIAWFERRFNRPAGPAPRNRAAGAILLATTVLLFAGGAWMLVYGAQRWSPVAGGLLQVWLIATTVAWKGLADAGRAVATTLYRPDLEAARRAVSHIVGRDTSTLSAEEVARAAVESVAENLVDAVVSPVLFAVVGGAPLAVLYRAVNTLDSMVGYRTARYRTFGWASARCDDILNWVPARLAVGILVLAAALRGCRWREAWRVARRDGRRHPSPNGGQVEAAMAGALGVRLGGTNRYHGVTETRPYLGDPVHPLTAARIGEAVQLLHTAGWILWTVLAAAAVRP
jgi:adenosylcobinamide-phosphate synthase